MVNTLVFLHGSGDTAAVWHFQLAHFGDRAYALDLPGHGQRAATPLPDGATVLDYAHAVYDIIQSERSLERSLIAGHSLGGAIALTMALEYGNLLGGLILIGTGARLRVHPTLLEEARQAPEQAKLHATELGVAPANVSIVPEILGEQIIPKAKMLYPDLAACNAFDVMDSLHEIQLPTLIICGTQDRLTPVKYSTYLHQHIASSKLQLIDNAGHYVMWEQVAAVNLAIEKQA